MFVPPAGWDAPAHTPPIRPDWALDLSARGALEREQQHAKLSLLSRWIVSLPAVCSTIGHATCPPPPSQRRRPLSCSGSSSLSSASSDDWAEQPPSALNVPETQHVLKCSASTTSSNEWDRTIDLSRLHSSASSSSSDEEELRERYESLGFVARPFATSPFGSQEWEPRQHDAIKVKHRRWWSSPCSLPDPTPAPLSPTLSHAFTNGGVQPVHHRRARSASPFGAIGDMVPCSAAAPSTPTSTMDAVPLALFQPLTMSERPSRPVLPGIPMLEGATIRRLSLPSEPAVPRMRRRSTPLSSMALALEESGVRLGKTLELHSAGWRNMNRREAQCTTRLLKDGEGNVHLLSVPQGQEDRLDRWVACRAQSFGLAPFRSKRCRRRSPRSSRSREPAPPLPSDALIKIATFS